MYLTSSESTHCFTKPFNHFPCCISLVSAASVSFLWITDCFLFSLSDSATVVLLASPLVFCMTCASFRGCENNHSIMYATLMVISESYQQRGTYCRNSMINLPVSFLLLLLLLLLLVASLPTPMVALQVLVFVFGVSWFRCTLVVLL